MKKTFFLLGCVLFVFSCGSLSIPGNSNDSDSESVDQTTTTPNPKQNSNNAQNPANNNGNSSNSNGNTSQPNQPQTYTMAECRAIVNKDPKYNLKVGDKVKSGIGIVTGVPANGRTWGLLNSFKNDQDAQKAGSTGSSKNDVTYSDYIKNFPVLATTAPPFFWLNFAYQFHAPSSGDDYDSHDIFLFNENCTLMARYRYTYDAGTSNLVGSPGYPKLNDPF